MGCSASIATHDHQLTTSPIVESNITKSHDSELADVKSAFERRAAERRESTMKDKKTLETKYAAAKHQMDIAPDDETREFHRQEVEKYERMLNNLSKMSKFIETEADKELEEIERQMMTRTKVYSGELLKKQLQARRQVLDVLNGIPIESEVNDTEPINFNRSRRTTLPTLFIRTPSLTENVHEEESDQPKRGKLVPRANRRTFQADSKINNNLNINKSKSLNTNSNNNQLLNSLAANSNTNNPINDSILNGSSGVGSFTSKRSGMPKSRTLGSDVLKPRRSSLAINFMTYIPENLADKKAEEITNIPIPMVIETQRSPSKLEEMLSPASLRRTSHPTDFFIPMQSFTEEV